MTSLKHHDLIDRMSLEEKATLLSGANFWNTAAIERLDIPSIMLTDGPHGLRKQGGKADHLGLNESVPATCFPTAITLAASWDTALVRKVGEAIALEAKAENVGVLLGPGLNIIRNPLAGRSFEYFSEDPYLTGKLAARMVRGIQSTGVAASPKHYAVNSQEYLRMSINEVVDERTLHEIYLEGFRRVVTEGHPKTLMSSYNKVNGTLANENKHLLQNILRKQWEFHGVVVTDWGGEGDRIAGLRAGNQLEMPSSGGVTTKQIIQAVETGELEVSRVNESVDDLLTLIFAQQYDTSHTHIYDGDVAHQKAALIEQNHTLAIQAAEASIILLKNDHATLPLRPKTRTAIIGDFAQKARYQGAGSSLINPTSVENALENLEKTDLSITGYEPGFKRFGVPSKRLLRRAIALARASESVVVFLGLDETSEAEGLDREHMQLPQVQLNLIEELSKLAIPITVVLAGGGPVELPFANSVAAIVHTQLAGQGGGAAIARVLTGVANPSGKLSISYPLTYDDVSSKNYFPGKEQSAEHREGIFVGYRGYDKTDTKVRYPFGHGLSYTSFEYSALIATKNEARLTITNSGTVAGKEVAQLYVRAQNTADTIRPEKELKGFKKVTLEPGESKEITFTFDEHTFAVYDIATKAWVQVGGTYDILVGSSSRDIHQAVPLSIVGKVPQSIQNAAALPSYVKGEVQNISDEEFMSLLGTPLPPSKWDRNARLTPQDTFSQLRYTNGFGRLVYGLLQTHRKFLRLLGKYNSANNMMFIINMPFYKLERFTGGKVSMKGIRRFLWLVNLDKKGP